MAHTAKTPKKSILRTQSSENYARKKTKFDETNILETLHPPDKDYGRMPIDEEKTPFVFQSNPSEMQELLDTELLTIKLRLAANTQTPSFGDEVALSDEEFPETDEERVQRIVFERRRKAHYNEYSAVKLARELIKIDLERIEEMIDEAPIIELPSDISICQTDVETEELFTEIASTRTSGSAGTTTADNISEPILIAPKPKEIEDLLDPTHPCYNRIVKQQHIRHEQQLREQQQQLQQQQGNK